MTVYKAKRPKRAPTHPGAILREDVLPALGLSVSKAAADLGVTRQALHRILSETAAISPEMALKLGRLCGDGPDIWLKMQVGYDVWHARERMGRALENVPERHKEVV